MRSVSKMGIKGMKTKYDKLGMNSLVAQKHADSKQAKTRLQEHIKKRFTL